MVPLNKFESHVKKTLNKKAYYRVTDHLKDIDVLLVKLRYSWWFKSYQMGLIKIKICIVKENDDSKPIIIVL